MDNFILFTSRTTDEEGRSPAIKTFANSSSVRGLSEQITWLVSSFLSQYLRALTLTLLFLAQVVCGSLPA